MHLAAVGALCLALPACAAQPPAKPPPANQLETPSYARDPGAFIARVTALRGLPLKRAVPIVRYSDAAAFEAAYDRASGPELRAEGVPHLGSAIFAALGMDPAQHRGRAETHLNGFYDSHGARIAILHHPSAARDEDEVIAHELVHALQDQTFRSYSRLKPYEGSPTPVDFDAELAEAALLEGDATWVASTLMASRRFVSPRTLFGLGTLEGGSTPRHWEEEPALDRKLRWLAAFPYTYGPEFVEVLRRSGGVALLHAAFRAAPRTTEQVLHPEKYLAGEQPADVGMLDHGKGVEVLARGRLGEYILSTVLLTCNDSATTVAAASGWNGDAFVLTSRPGFRELRLVTAWDTTTDAIEFERAMRRAASCWDHRERIDGDFDGPTGVTRQGNVVVVIRGEGEHTLNSDHGVEIQSDLAKALVGRVGNRPVPSKPFGNVVAWHPPRVADPGPTAVEAGRIVMKVLGIAIPLPEGARLSDNHGFTMALDEMGSSMIRVQPWLHIVSRESVKGLVDEGSLFANELDGPAPELPTKHTAAEIRGVELPIGRGFAVDFSPSEQQPNGAVTTRPDAARLLVVPLCGDDAALLIALKWTGLDQKAQLERVVAGIRKIDSNPPACRMIPPQSPQ